MAEKRMSATDVASWVAGVLPEYNGQYEVLDHLFVRSAVRVVTTRRDAFYDIPRDRWNVGSDEAGHAAIGEELRVWARRVMPPHA
jgi:hypothetical protein